MAGEEVSRTRNNEMILNFKKITKIEHREVHNYSFFFFSFIAHIFFKKRKLHNFAFNNDIWP